MPNPVVIALGSNLGDRHLNLKRALHELRAVVTLVRLSSVLESEAVDAPPDSPPFLNMVALGYSELAPEELMGALLAIEGRLGRRRGVRNSPRTIDLDLILYGAHLSRTPTVTLPHPRYLGREFVMGPLRELELPWVDPACGVPLGGATPAAESLRHDAW